jgi:hypothetical protein
MTPRLSKGNAGSIHRLRAFHNFIIKVFPDQMHSGSGMVYGGVEAQRRTGVLIAPYSNLNMLFDSAFVWIQLKIGKMMETQG